MTPAGPLVLLVYEYGPDVLERRAPHRPAHLRLVADWKADGRIVLAGPVGGEQPTGALIAFREGEDPQPFIEADPYVSGGVVRAHRVERWTLV